MLSAIILIPLIGFLINGLGYVFFQTGKGQKTWKAETTGGIATGAIAVSFCLAVAAFFRLRGLSEESRVIEETLYHWISVGSFTVDFALRLDPLSSVFTLVITGVGTLIHLYAVGYMSHDETPGKFFAYLNLFCAFMLVLVLGASLPVLFLGWEGVGLCSYLLISYWYTDIEKAKAGKKAFLVNRIGDLGFLLGAFLLYKLCGTLDLSALVKAVGLVDPEALTAVGLLLFLACTGKSAQLPLYLWLPDAMAGPTPVSALIHAATMVTSGIYLLARLSFLYRLTPDAMQVIAVTGAATAFFAATIAIAQNDIKKILAYSTISQLGLMFLACGVGAFSAGVFHVVTHAFFKALLFLGAGSVIHGMHGEQDIRRMGGLKTSMPKTYLTFTAGWLAICGLPPFSGFFSKDEILWKAFSSPYGSPILWAVGAITAVLTALYMTRLFSLVFLGSPRFSEKHPPHESPFVMTLPLVCLAVLAAGGGFLGLPHGSVIDHWLHFVVGEVGVAEDIPEIWEWLFMAISTLLALAAVLFGMARYRKPRPENGGFWTVLENKWYVDEAVQRVLVRPFRAVSQFLWKGLDVSVIDRIVVGSGRLTQWAADTGRGIQTGSLNFYLLILVLGLIASVGYLLYGIR